MQTGMKVYHSVYEEFLYLLPRKWVPIFGEGREVLNGREPYGWLGVSRR